MHEYRIYPLGAEGHIVDRAKFVAEDDENAREHAKQYVDGHDIELWHQGRKILEFKAPK